MTFQREGSMVAKDLVWAMVVLTYNDMQCMHGQLSSQKQAVLELL